MPIRNPIPKNLIRIRFLLISRLVITIQTILVDGTLSDVFSYNLGLSEGNIIVVVFFRDENIIIYFFYQYQSYIEAKIDISSVIVKY